MSVAGIWLDVFEIALALYGALVTVSLVALFTRPWIRPLLRRRADRRAWERGYVALAAELEEVQ